MAVLSALSAAAFYHPRAAEQLVAEGGRTEADKQLHAAPRRGSDARPGDSDPRERHGCPVTGTIRGLPTEVPLGRKHGLAGDCVVNCDNLFTIPKQAVGVRRGELDPESLARLRTALMIALDLEEP